MFFDHISISDRKTSALHLASSIVNEAQFEIQRSTKKNYYAFAKSHLISMTLFQRLDYRIGGDPVIRKSPHWKCQM